MTPLMHQYFAIKKLYPDALILFQVGDFYELFYKDAQQAAAFLGITLTKRGKSDDEPIPLCGVPRHASDQYIIKLVQGGFHVVVCDQQGEAEQGKLVERRVVGVFTPGTVHDARLLEARSATILCVTVSDTHTRALLFLELITGRCTITSISAQQEYLFEAEIVRHAPREVVVAPDPEPFVTALFERIGCSMTRHAVTTDPSQALEWLRGHADQSAYQLASYSPLIHRLVTLLYSYLVHHVPEGLARIGSIKIYAPDDFLLLDAATQRNLELVYSLQNQEYEGSLFSVLDHAVTTMGSRMIRRWILQPLKQQQVIERRLSAVQYLVDQAILRKKLADELQGVGDLERVSGRILLRRATMHDYLHLVRALPAVGAIIRLLDAPEVYQMIGQLNRYRNLCDELGSLLEVALNQDSALEGKIRTGYDQELDRVRTLSQKGEQAISSFEQQERERTGIGSLKVRLNGVYGYGIEVTKPNRHLVPQEYRLVQTLVNRDRFVTDPLALLERDIIGAQRQAQERDSELFENIQAQVLEQGQMLAALAESLARLDAILGFAEAASMYRYVRPVLHAGRDMLITEGRHPVVERFLSKKNNGSGFVPNSLVLHQESSLWIITGPNMGGKSTFLRQNALIVIMAHIGSFVPAREAVIPIFDRLFTRIGASDNVSEGKSTFFVEMEEVARMCQESTAESFIILDEIGRGTSTYDGIAIAQGVLEYLYRLKTYALCATHYHELAQALTTTHTGIMPYYAATVQTSRGVTLLHTICPGIAEGSFGISVARQAGIPQEVLQRAELVLQQLVRHKRLNSAAEDHAYVPAMVCTFPQHAAWDEIFQRLKRVRIDDTTPREALAVLHELVTRVNEPARPE